MDILIATAKDEPAWRDAMQACLPEAAIHLGPDAPACDYAVVWKPATNLFDGQPRLRALFSLGAGVNALLAMPTLPHGVPLVRMEDAGMAPQMVEYALYVALREFRRFGEYASDQASKRWAPRPARSRNEWRIGVLGLGVLGGSVARALAEFGFDVSGWSRTPKALEGVRCEHGAAGLDRVLACSDMLVLFLPVTSETTQLLDAARLARLPRGAIVVNLGRGELVDEHALLVALDTGQVGAAYLDVFHEEPLPAQHAFWRHPRVAITPHVAALTDVAMACMQIAQKIRRLEAGAAVSGTVDPSRGY